MPEHVPEQSLDPPTEYCEECGKEDCVCACETCDGIGLIEYKRFVSYGKYIPEIKKCPDCTE